MEAGAHASRTIIVELRPATPPMASGKRRVLSILNEFFKSPIGGASLTLLFTTIIGGFIANYYSNQSQREAEYNQQVRDSEASRRILIDNFNKIFSTRRTAIGLVRSAIIAKATKKEVDERWALYQQSYMAYNTSVFTFKAEILEYLGARTATIFTNMLENSITPSLSRIDGCLTKAYRLASGYRYGPASDQLEKCGSESEHDWKMLDEIDSLQSCFGTLDTELMFAIYLENRYDHLPREERERAWSDNRLKPQAGAPGTASGEPRCAAEADWVCQRRLARAVITKKLAVPACLSLAEKNYQLAKSGTGSRPGDTSPATAASKSAQ